MHKNTTHTHHTQETSAGVIQEVFLSPRVVDAALLAEFAESLRGLLEGAAAQREQLQAVVTASETVAETLHQTVTKASQRLKPAVKLIPTIDQKLEQAETALERADKAARTAKTAAAKAAKAAAKESDTAAIRDATNEGALVLQKAQAAFDEAIDQTKKLEARLGKLTSRAKTAVTALDTECKSRLDTATRSAQDVLGTMVAEVDARAEEAITRLTALVEERRATAEAAVGTTEKMEAHPDNGATLSQATAAVAEAHADIETLIASIKARTSSMADELEAHADEAVRRVAGASERAKSVEHMATIAETRLKSALVQLQLIDDRGREIAEGASQALAAFDDELAVRMDAVRNLKEQLVTAPTGKPSAKAKKTPGSRSPSQTAEAKPAGKPKKFVRIDRPTAG